MNNKQLPVSYGLANLRHPQLSCIADKLLRPVGPLQLDLV